jgi:cation diffusion facilitator CzcD-associated flavoprotein CzcO
MARYCVIGAGAAGLGALQTLLEAGFTVDCFEQTDRVGGHWHTDYDALHLITSRDVTAYEGFPMPAHYPLFPRRDEMRAYLESFAETFGLHDKITFNTGVLRVEPEDSAGTVGSAGWRVYTDRGDEAHYDGVLVANGHLWDKQVPNVPGTFTGTQLHSCEYRNTGDIEGTRVLVVGSGNSGCDLAVDAAQHRFDTCISVRRGHIYQPKTFLGKPRSELAFLREFSLEEQDLLTRLLIRMSVGTWEDYPGLPKPMSTTLAEQAPVVNNLLLYWIQHGRVAVVPGLERFDGKTVYFTDGTSREFDTIVWATGFKASLPFLSSEFLQWQDGVPLRLGGATVPVGVEKLYFVGLIAPRGPQPPVYPAQTRVIAQMLRVHEEAGPHGAPVSEWLAASQEPEWRIDILRPLWQESLDEASRIVASRSASVEVGG